jgi:hypothetical protein
MTAILSFLAAVRAGDMWARATLAGAALAAFLAFAAWQVWRVYDAGGDAREATIKSKQQEKIDAAKAGADRVIGGDDSRVRNFDRD